MLRFWFTTVMFYHASIHVRVRLTTIKCSFVTDVTQDGIWTAFSHPLPLCHMDSGNAPYASHATSYPSQLLSTFAFLPPSSISTLIEILPKQNDPLPLIRFAGLPITNKKKYAKKSTSKHSHQNNGNTPRCKPIHGGSEFKTRI